jgi:hypothetical protein
MEGESTKSSIEVFNILLLASFSTFEKKYEKLMTIILYNNITDRQRFVRH